MAKTVFPAIRVFLILAVVCTARAEESPKSIVFVCEHGTVKSLIAASFFNRMAVEQKIGYRAIARGTALQEAIPPAVASNLQKDGFPVASFKPQALTKTDMDRAAAVIAFCELPKDLATSAKLSSWLDVPPASVDYEKAKAVMLPRIEALVAGLKHK